MEITEISVILIFFILGTSGCLNDTGLISDVQNPINSENSSSDSEVEGGWKGKDLNIPFNITSTSNETGKFHATLKFRDQDGREFAYKADSKSVRVKPGETKKESFEYTTEGHLPNGEYNAVVTLWRAYEGELTTILGEKIHNESFKIQRPKINVTMKSNKDIFVQKNGKHIRNPTAYIVGKEKEVEMKAGIYNLTAIPMNSDNRSDDVREDSESMSKNITLTVEGPKVVKFNLD